MESNLRREYRAFYNCVRTKFVAIVVKIIVPEQIERVDITIAITITILYCINTDSLVI